MAVRFARSAHKHGVSESRIRYVLENHVWSYPLKAGFTLFFGPDRNGIDLEIGTVTRDDDEYVVHAMKIREKFRREYERHLPWPK